MPQSKLILPILQYSLKFCCESLVLSYVFLSYDVFLRRNHHEETEK